MFEVRLRLPFAGAETQYEVSELTAADTAELAPFWEGNTGGPREEYRWQTVSREDAERMAGLLRNLRYRLPDRPEALPPHVEIVEVDSGPQL